MSVEELSLSFQVNTQIVDMILIDCTNLNNTANNTDSYKNDNIETITEHQVALFIWKLCPLVLILLGMFGNVTTIAVLCKIPWKGSTMHHHLIGLALADLCLLLTGLLRRWMKFVFHLDVRDLHWMCCKFHTFLTYSAGTMSAWFLVFVTAQRTLAILFPSEINFFCSTRWSKVGLAVVILFSFILSVPVLNGSDLRDQCYFYDHFSKYVTAWFDMSISSLLPSLILASCNVILVWTLRRSVETKRGSLGSVISNIATRKRNVSSLTVTLILMSSTFLMLTLPVCVYFVFYSLVLENNEEKDVLLVARTELVDAVTNMLWYSNSVINFLLYCLSGKRFRDEFLKLICQKAKGDNLYENSRPIHTLTKQRKSDRLVERQQNKY